MRLRTEWKVETWVETERINRIKAAFVSHEVIRREFRHYSPGEMGFEKFVMDKVESQFPGAVLLAVIARPDMDGWTVHIQHDSFPEISPHQVLPLIDIEDGMELPF